MNCNKSNSSTRTKGIENKVKIDLKDESGKTYQELQLGIALENEWKQLLCGGQKESLNWDLRQSVGCFP